jgi:DNA-binding response OmpR family regulator
MRPIDTFKSGRESPWQAALVHEAAIMRILIAEDSQTQAVDLRRRLEAMGPEVVVTADGLQAWNQLRNRPERLVILDWMMPIMNGLDLCRKIRAEIRSTYIYVILLTAKTHRHERLQGLSAGADDFLAKPIEHCELDIALKTAQRIIAAQEALLEPATSGRVAATGRALPPGLVRRQLVAWWTTQSGAAVPDKAQKGQGLRLVPGKHEACSGPA